MKPTILLGLLVCGGFLAGCQRPDPVHEATAKLKPAVDVYVNAWNTGNLNTLDAICDPHVVRFDRMADAYRGLDSLKGNIALVRAMYPDFKVAVEEELYVGDRAVVRWTITGTNIGPGDFPPTGKSFKISGLSLCRFVDGKLAEEHAAYDSHSMLKQLGFYLTPPSN